MPKGLGRKNIMVVHVKRSLISHSFTAHHQANHMGAACWSSRSLAWDQADSSNGAWMNVHAGEFLYHSIIMLIIIYTLLCLIKFYNDLNPFISYIILQHII